MAITAGQTALAADIIGLVSIFVSTTGTLSITTVAGQKVIVIAKGNDTLGNNGSSTILLKYNGVTKDTCSLIIHSGAYADGTFSYSLMYTETPGAGTHDITVTGQASGSNCVIMVLKL